jgi:hypothetical protein
MWGTKRLPARARICLLLIPISFEIVAVFVYRRIHLGEWAFDDAIAVAVISALLLLPASATLFYLVRGTSLFIIGVCLFVFSCVVGIVLAAAEGGGEAGILLTATPVLSIVAAVILAIIDASQETR